MSGHYFGSVWYFLAAAAIIAIGWCTTNASGDIGPHGTNLPWVQKPIGASFGVCGDAGTGSARMCELPFLEFDYPGCAAMQENPRVVRQPVLSWVYVGEGSCWARVVKLFEGWCFLLEIIVVTSSSDVSVGGHGWRSKLEEQEFGSEFAKCPPVSTAGSLCWQRQKTCQQNAHTVFEPSEYDLSGGPTLLIRGFEMGFCDDIQPDVCFSSLNSLRKWPKRNLFLSWLLQSLQHLRTLDDDKRHMDRNSGQWVSENYDVWVWAKVVARLWRVVWSMAWDASRLCDLTSFVWVGLVDASGLEQPTMKKRCFVTAVAWQCFLVTFSHIGCAIDPCWRLGTVDACSAYALLACFFCGRFSAVAKLRPCYRLVLWGLLGNTCDWDIHHVYVSSLYWLATACAGFDLQHLHDSSCMTIFLTDMCFSRHAWGWCLEVCMG